MSGTPWALQASPEGSLYDGPHGPMTILNETPPGATVIRVPGGEARLDMDIRTRDEQRLKEGVPFSMPGAEYRLRRDGKRLVLEGPEGAVGVLRRTWRGRFVVEDGAGHDVLHMKGAEIAGELLDGVAPEHIALTLAVAASGTHVEPNRWGALTPF